MGLIVPYAMINTSFTDPEEGERGGDAESEARSFGRDRERLRRALLGVCGLSGCGGVIVSNKLKGITSNLTEMSFCNYHPIPKHRIHQVRRTSSDLKHNKRLQMNC